MLTKPFLHVAVLVVVSFGLYLRAYDHVFLYFDDPIYVSENTHVLQGISIENIPWAWRSVEGGHVHPLTWMTLMFQQNLGLKSAFTHVLLNAVLHGLAMFFVWDIFKKITHHPVKAALITACVAWHPMRVESVAWVSERKDVLSACFFLAALCVYVRNAFKPTFKAMCIVTVLYACCLLSKPTQMFFLCVVFLVSWHQQVPAKPWLKAYAVWCVLSLYGVAVAVYAQMATHAWVEVSAIPLWDRLSNACVACVAYIGLHLFPHRLSVFYPWHFPQPGMVCVAMLACAAITCAVVKNRTLLCGWLWYGVCLLPYVGIFQAGGQSMANRFTYLASIGLFWMGVEWVCGLQWRNTYVPYATMACVCVFWATQTWHEISFFQNTRTLFQHALDSDPENFFAHNNLGVAYDREGFLEKAGFHFKESLRFHPGYIEALNNYGSYLARIGHVQEAVPYFEQTLAKNPQHSTALNNLKEAHRVLTYPR